ncbi:MAG TPA: hypothetical protein P5256_00315 [Beijerinckiaceae bacterium]|nr:hypothetical protein [Rhodoblastus sp.]MCC2107205.1 hypothetical protein [Hyphomicrobiales bacterium]MCO5088654.1 hypothetical protein [Methylobacteriaceae bacterium]HRY01539.1 hypothetical protein [Beijerinckiaceae bacterium]
MIAEAEPYALLFEDLRDQLPEPVMVEWGTWPNEIPFLSVFGEHLNRQLYLGSRLFCWASGGVLRVGLRVYRTQSGRPATYVFAEAPVTPAAVAEIRAAEFIDVLIFKDIDPLGTTDDDFENFVATFIKR